MNELVIAATNLVLSASNTLVAFFWPQVTDFAKRLDLPDGSSTAAEVRRFQMWPEFQGASFRLKNGNCYMIRYGYLVGYDAAIAYYGAQDPAQIARFYGTLRIDRTEAVALARQAIRRLGYTEEMLHADLEPEVTGPFRDGTNIIPRFEISWPSPNRSSSTLQIEINGESKRVESFFCLNKNLHKDLALPPLPDEVAKAWAKPKEPRMPEDRARGMMRRFLPEVTRFVQAVRLPTQTPVGTNQAKGFTFGEDQFGVYGQIELQDGVKFEVRGGRVVAFHAPDRFFMADGEVKVREFVGEWRVTEKEAIKTARTAVRRLGFPASIVAADPEVDRPEGAARSLVPRCLFRWAPAPEGLPLGVLAEVDGSSGKLKCLSVVKFVR